MDPPEFFIHPGSGLVEISHSRSGHVPFDLAYRVCQVAGTAFHHAAYGSRGDRYVKYIGKDFVGAFYTDSAHRI